LVLGLSLPLRDINDGNTDLECSSGKGAWRANLVCRGIAKRLCAKARVFVSLEDHLELHQSPEKLALQMDEGL
jgi:hypothetical protein